MVTKSAKAEITAQFNTINANVAKMNEMGAFGQELAKALVKVGKPALAITPFIEAGIITEVSEETKATIDDIVNMSGVLLDTAQIAQTSALLIPREAESDIPA